MRATEYLERVGLTVTFLSPVGNEYSRMLAGRVGQSRRHSCREKVAAAFANGPSRSNSQKIEPRGEINYVSGETDESPPFEGKGESKTKR